MKTSARIWSIAKARTTRDFPESMMCAVTVADVLEYLDERDAEPAAETLTAEELEALLLLLKSVASFNVLAEHHATIADKLARMRGALAGKVT
jgi:hypothetical protein